MLWESHSIEMLPIAALQRLRTPHLSRQLRSPLTARVRNLADTADTADTAAPGRNVALGAYGAKGSKGSGKSLMGSKRRGTGALTSEEAAAIESGDIGWDGSRMADDELDAGDVLMEVLAEDHRHKLVHVEFVSDDGRGEQPVTDDPAQDAPRGPKLAHRKYLTSPGVGPGTAYQRQQMAQRQRLEAAESAAFDYALPDSVKKAREHEKRSRARLRDHDVIENRIQEAMLAGAFDDLPGRGKPLTRDENPFEAMSGDAVAHRILKNAGIAPGWVEQGKEIRTALLAARANLAIEWQACVPVWPQPPAAAAPHAVTGSEEGRAGSEAEAQVKAKMEAAAKAKATGGWRIYHAPQPLQAAADGAATDGEPVDAKSSLTKPVDAKGSLTKPVDAKSSLTTQAAHDGSAPGQGCDSDLARVEVTRAAQAVAVDAAAARGPHPAQWATTVETFHEEVRNINRLIDSYNLSVPAAWQQMHRLQPNRELQRALHEAPRRAAELKAERRSRRSTPSTSAAQQQAHASGAMLLGGTTPTFALHQGPTFPSIFESLTAALFSK